MPEPNDYPSDETVLKRGKQLYDCIARFISAFPNVYGFAIRPDHIELMTRTPSSKEEQEKIRETLVRFAQCNADHNIPYCKTKEP